MAEKDVVNATMRYLKTMPGCFAWKEHGGMYGTAGKLTKLQESTIQKIKAAKGEAFKVTSVGDVKSILDILEMPHDDSLDLFR